MKLSTTASPLYLRFLQQALFVQAILFVFTGACIMDFGQMNRCAIVAIFAQLAGICIIVCRRPGVPTHGDVLFFRYGCVWLLAIAAFIAPTIQTWLGGRTLLFWWFDYPSPPDGYVSGAAFLAALVWIIAYSFLAWFGKQWPAVSETLDETDSTNEEVPSTKA